MVRHWIDEITKLENVRGVFITSNLGKLIEAQGLDLDRKSMEEIALRLLRMISIIDENSPVAEVELFWKDLFIICKFSHKILLVAVCNNPAILALLRITLNVSMSHILQDKKIAKIAKSHTSARAQILRKGKFSENEMKLLASI